MPRFLKRYKPVHTGVSIVSQEAYTDYRSWSEIRDPKKFKDVRDYRKIARKIWKKVAENSLEHESGVYARDFFYLVPQVIDNVPFVKLPNGKIKTNYHTDGDIYTPIFCNLFEQFNHFCWSLDGCFTETYTVKFNEKINKSVPKYYFILPTLLKNKL